MYTYLFSHVCASPFRLVLLEINKPRFPGLVLLSRAAGITVSTVLICKLAKLSSLVDTTEGSRINSRKIREGITLSTLVVIHLLLSP